MMEYKMIDANRAKEFNHAVNQALANGWEIYGYPLKTMLPGSHSCVSIHYSQAMVRGKTAQQVRKSQ